MKLWEFCDTEHFYNSTASDPPHSTNPSTLERPRLVIEQTTAEPSPQPHFSPLQAIPSGSQLTVPNGIEVDLESRLRAIIGLGPGEDLELDKFGQPTEAMKQRFLQSMGVMDPTPEERRMLERFFGPDLGMRSGLSWARE